MKRVIFAFFIIMATTLEAEVPVKIKNLCFIDGYKINQVYGYGLVVGLQGTGDSKSSLTKNSLKNVLNSIGLQDENPSTKNTAAVIISAIVPPNLRIGEKVDVYVSSIGDAKSLAGGVLIQSPLRGADGNIYIVAQGKVAFPAGEDRRSGVKTSGIITGGGIAEREIKPDFLVRTADNKDAIQLVLKSWDYSTADKILKALKKKLKRSDVAIAENGRISVTVDTEIPLVEFISTIENIEVVPDAKAVVVINERDGTIVTGGNVTLSEAMVSKRGLTIQIEKSDKKVSSAYIKESSTVKDLVDALNAVGASTDDIISILKGLKDAGALHADLVIR
ncbi:MAG TPA: flagellar basal body P-ring protein FlgI [Spirochaetota bacterium]|jgi:flagellar P-ring protein precursor FlgI|nr:flagellar basal body P-ring protein FlgI [Spirochaetota bacterium]HOV08666.1 flagellar basal body P-ring protein FlgI [Spirochaetota bacterium]HPD77548.1 flagellar basal body P-ring protein FlgI [Spirochaetota bacterium]HPP94316.1 flagellar basal body P-ring protein FlgI [Spirochaetota bacterium]HRS63786.1 flagellar basal body P-ring protein FlgI [Spirochaetota bacterium]